MSTVLFERLQENDVRLAKLKPGKTQGRMVTLDVDAGRLDPVAMDANVGHRGGFELIAGRRAVKVRKLRLDTAGETLSGRIDGKPLTIASLQRLRGEPKEFGAEIVAGLKLSGQAAARLNRALGLQGLFRGGRSLGALFTVVQPELATIAWGTIAMGGPDTAFSKLESREVQMGIWGAAERWSAPGETYFLFEVEPTAVKRDASTGILEGEPDSGVTLEIYGSPPRNMLLRGPRIDLAARELSATVSALSTDDPVTATIATLDYSAAEFQIRPGVGAFELMGIRAVANQLIADQLNARFATPGLFQAGETLARISVTLWAR